LIWLLARGYTVIEASALMRFVPRWIEELLARDNFLGEAALGDLRRHNGAPRRLLTPELLDRLQVCLREPPPDGGVWSSGKVAAWMASELGLEKVAVQRGWSAQAPRPRNPNAASAADQAAYKTWRRSSPRRSPPTLASRSRCGRATSTGSA
jgi:hypothetical protein